MYLTHGRQTLGQEDVGDSINYTTGDTSFTVNWSDGSSNTYPIDTTTTSPSWWSSIAQYIGPVTTGIASIIRAITGTPATYNPPGYRFNATTGKYEPITTTGTGFFGDTSGWMMPLLAIGAVILLTRK